MMVLQSASDVVDCLIDKTTFNKGLTDRPIDLDHVKPNVTEIQSGARGLEILGIQIDRVLIFANKIRIYILPTGYFEFNIEQDYEGNPDQVSTSMD